MTVQDIELVDVYRTLAQRTGDKRQPRRERRALSGLALDHDAAAVAVEDVFHERKSEPGTALGPALRHIHAIETLGEARQVLGGDAGAVVAHRDQRLAAARTLGGREVDAHTLARSAVFERVLDQVLEHAGELVAVAEDDHRLRRKRERDLDVAVERK